MDENTMYFVGLHDLFHFKHVIIFEKHEQLMKILHFGIFTAKENIIIDAPFVILQNLLYHIDLSLFLEVLL